MANFLVTAYGVSMATLSHHRLLLNEYDTPGVDVQLVAACEAIGVNVTFLVRIFRHELAHAQLLDGFEAVVSAHGQKCGTVVLAPQDENSRVVTGFSHALKLDDVVDREADNPALDVLARDLRQRLAEAIPPVFLSMEHFAGKLAVPMSTRLTTLNEHLVLSALNSAAATLTGFAAREALHYLAPVRASDALAYHRIEVREDKFEYVPLNEFTVYQNGATLVAIGITQDEPDFHGRQRLFLTAWFGAAHRELITAMFGEAFEKSLLTVLSLKGGKFTGDQKVLRLKDRPALDDLKLEPAVRAKIDREILGFFALEPWYRKAGLPFKRGVALYGPPGTGKTMLARILAGNRAETVIWVRAGDMHDTADMSRIFRLARLGAPSILILEDIDFYLQDRDRNKDNGIGVANLLAQLDGLEENDGLLVLVTTNRIETVEKAIVERPGRIDSKVFMGELGREVVMEILTAKLGKFARGFASWTEVLPSTLLMTGAQAVELGTMVLRYSIADLRSEAAEVTLTSEAVKKALKDLERARNAQKVSGFGAE